MKRISDDLFESEHYNENVYALRLKDGEFYFLAWFEDAENYDCVLARKPIQLDRDLIMNTSLYTAVTESEGWNSAISTLQLDCRDDDGNTREDILLSVTHSYQRNGKYDPADHDIFVTEESEWQQVCDSLRDGDYIIVMQEPKGLVA